MKLSQTKLALSLSSVLLLGGLILVPQAAGAQTDTDPAGDSANVDEAPQVASIAVFGTGITLSVEVGQAGNLTTVELLDASGSAPAGAVATNVSPNKVKFEIDENETLIEVKAEDHKIQSKIRVNELAGLVGPHTWTGELFGAGNGTTDIAFTVSDDDGVPVIELISVTGPGSYADAGNTEFDDDEIKAKLRIEAFDSEGNRARIDINVEVETDDEDDRGAKLKISIHRDLYVDDKPDHDDSDKPDHDDSDKPDHDDSDDPDHDDSDDSDDPDHDDDKPDSENDDEDDDSDDDDSDDDDSDDDDSDDDDSDDDDSDDSDDDEDDD